MIERIVKDPTTNTYKSLEDVTQKLNYFRQLSTNGLHNLTDNEIELLSKEFSTTFNLNLSFFADIPNETLSCY